ncbi:MAG: 4Fe-4S dicluster domain-containing protein [Coriobacteriales bacterium]|nr:4Fe-4S dicluster domain-containing protein [Coriobacteriales bacterium]
MTQYAILTDLNRCVGCLACSVACKSVNDVPIGNFWTKILRVGPNPKFEGADFPDIEMYFLPVGCQHCGKPECVAVCPTRASTKHANGSVQIDKEKCIGCQFCVMACPYGVRYLNEEEKVVEKCTLCNQIIEAGGLPQCVAQCGGRARYFGDLEQGLESFKGPELYGDEYVTVGGELSRAATDGLVKQFSEGDIHKLPDVGNDPSFRYILRKFKWQG